MFLQSILQRVLEDIKESSLQSLQSLDVLQDSNLLCVSRVSSNESWKTFMITELRLIDSDGQDWPR